ncbi:hypothetical protein TNCV_947501 [Trichonephila clavipes]|nr:hypothetical protein TNCV_947501 [Trichonephila clavipes]
MLLTLKGKNYGPMATKDLQKKVEKLGETGSFDVNTGKKFKTSCGGGNGRCRTSLARTKRPLVKYPEVQNVGYA